MMEGKCHFQRHNLSIQEKEALNTLASDSSIVIKPADKSRAIVVMNKKEYIAEASRQLQDIDFYAPINSDPTKHIQCLITVVCREAYAMGIIDSNLFEYLQVPFPRVPIFYI